MGIAAAEAPPSSKAPSTAPVEAARTTPGVIRDLIPAATTLAEPQRLRCRKGLGLDVHIYPPGELAPPGERPLRWSSARTWKVTLTFAPSAAGFESGPLTPGSCAFATRGVALRGDRDQLLAAYPLNRRPADIAEPTVRTEQLAPYAGSIRLNLHLGAGGGDDQFVRIVNALGDRRLEEVEFDVRQETNRLARDYERCLTRWPAYMPCPTLFEIVAYAR